MSQHDWPRFFANWPKKIRCSAADLAVFLRRVVVVRQNTPGIAFKIFILVGAQAPKKCSQSKSAQKQRYGDQKDQNIHRFLPFRRSAFSSTVMDEADIAMEAISGVASPTSATGTAITL